MFYLFLLQACNQSTDLDFFGDNRPKNPSDPIDENQEQQIIDSGINSGSTDTGSSTDTGTEEIRELYEVDNVSLNRYFLQNAEERQAVCNDGSTPIYYYKQGSGEHKDNWIVWLQGGAGCATPEECALRELSQPHLMSTDMHEGQPYYGINGIFIEDEIMNPDFHDWTKVFLVYCSSDHWSGNASIEETGDYHFRGHNILKSMIEDLSNPEIFPDGTLSEASEILIGGNSAGSWGLQINLDRIVKQVPNVPVKGYFDSHFKPLHAFEVELQQGFIDHTLSFLEEKITYQALVPDESCAAQEENLTNCFLPYLQNYIETPYFVLMDQFDYMCAGFMGAAQLTNFQEGMNQEGRLAPARNIHVWSNISAFYMLEIEGYTSLDILGNWYFNRNGPTNLIESNTFTNCDSL